MDCAVRRDEPSGLRDGMVDGQPARHREGAEDEEAAAERRRHETPLERRRREEKEEEEEFEILVWAGPVGRQRAREEERRRRTRTEALATACRRSHSLARALRLAHAPADQDRRDRRRVARAARGLDRALHAAERHARPDPHVVGAVPLGPHLTPSVQPPGYPFARGTPHAHVANPMMLSMELRQVHKLTVEPAQAADDYHTIPGRPLIPSRPSHAPPPAASAAIALVPREQLPPLPPLSGSTQQPVGPAVFGDHHRPRPESDCGRDARWGWRLSARTPSSRSGCGVPRRRPSRSSSGRGGPRVSRLLAQPLPHARDGSHRVRALPGSYEDAAYP